MRVYESHLRQDDAKFVSNLPVDLRKNAARAFVYSLKQLGEDLCGMSMIDIANFV